MIHVETQNTPSSQSSLEKNGDGAINLPDFTLYDKATGYKISTQKSLAFLYTNNENQKEKLRNQCHLSLQQQKNKISGNKLT